MVEINPVRTAEQAEAVRVLAYEFVDWLAERYPDWGPRIEAYLTAQKFHEQIKDVRQQYHPPTGECLLATLDGLPIGILMLKDIGGGSCEMNRMFVRPAGRGLAIGRALVLQLIAIARNMGFQTMTLSAGPRHHEALSLYRSVGFARDDAVHAVHPDSPSHYLKLRLDTPPAGEAA